MPASIPETIRDTRCAFAALSTGSADRRSKSRVRRELKSCMVPEEPCGGLEMGRYALRPIADATQANKLRAIRGDAKHDRSAHLPRLHGGWARPEPFAGARHQHRPRPQ